MSHAMERKLDQEAVGQRLFRYHQLMPDKLFSEIADTFPWDDPSLAERDKSESTVSETVAAYNRELEERAWEGDRFAMALLEGKNLAEELAE